MKDSQAVPLAFMRPGESGTLVEIRGMRHHDHAIGRPIQAHSKGYRRGHLYHSDRGHRLEHHLNHMGLIPGEKVRLIANNAPGPVIVAVKETRLCLGRGIAAKLMVQPDEENPEEEPGCGAAR